MQNIILTSCLIGTFTIAVALCSGALLDSFIAEKVDNRPEGRYHFNLLCYEFRDEWWQKPRDGITVLGGSSSETKYSSDFHTYVPQDDEWLSEPNNKVTFEGRHSMVTEAVKIPGAPDVEFFTQGGVMNTAAQGAVPVDQPLFRSMQPPQYLPGQETPEENTWDEPQIFSSGPGARARSASFSFDGEMYVFGGVTGDGVIKGDLWLMSSSATAVDWILIYAPPEFTSSSLYTASDTGWGSDSFSSGFSTGFGAFADDSSSSSRSNRENNQNALDPARQHIFDFGHEAEALEDILQEDEVRHHGIKYAGKKNNDAARAMWKRETAQRKKVLRSMDDHDLVHAVEIAQQQRSAKRRASLQQQQQHRRGSGDTAPFFPGDGAGREQEQHRDAGAMAALSDVDKELPRYGSCCVAYSTDSAVCIGGTGNAGDKNSVLHYKQGEYWWTKLAIANVKDGPKPVRDAACAFDKTIGNPRVIFYAGYDSRTGAATADTKIYFLNIATKTWSSTKPQPQMSPIFGHGMCFAPISKKIYMFGGRNTLRINASLLVLDTSPMNTLDFKWKLATSPLELLPAPRAYHITAAVGHSLFIGFGRQKDNAHGDLWEFDVLTNKWGSIQSGSFAARWGASAAVFGSAIFVFGGRTDVLSSSSHATNELLLYETAKQQLTAVTATNAPSARAFHVSFEASSGSIIVGLGQDTSGNYLDDWHAFSVASQQWELLSLEGDPIAARVGASAVQSYNETHSIVGLGYDGVAMDDLFFVEKRAGSVLRSTRIARGASVYQPRITKRAFASVAGRGRHILVCGGLVSSDLAAPPGVARCYQIDVDGTKNTVEIGSSTNRTAPVGLVGAAAAWIQDHMFSFGGQVISDPLVSDVFYNRPVHSHAKTVCTSGSRDTDDSNCALCGFGSTGTVNDGCQFTPKGYYTTVAGNTVPCPAGTFSNIKGASSSAVCSPCRIGTKNPGIGKSFCVNCSSGEFCAIGSSIGSSAASDRAVYLSEQIPGDGLLLEDNPSALTSLELPWLVLGIVGGTALALALALAIAILMSSRGQKNKVDYYIPEAVQVQLDKIFVAYADDGRELQLSMLVKIFNALGLGVPATVLEKTFWDISEDSGETFLRRDEFKKAFVDLIRVGLIPPFAGSEAEKLGREMPAAACRVDSGVDMSKLDSFRAQHKTSKLGEPMRVRQTSYGGVFTVFLYLTQLVVLLAVLVNFLYANTTEIKAIVPYPVVQAAFGESIGEVESDFLVEVAATGPIRESARFRPSDSSTDRALKTCLDLSSADPAACINETKVTPTGFTIPRAGNVATKCRFDNTTRSCVIIWTCSNCTVVTAASLLFQFSIAQSAERITTRVETTAGIRLPAQLSTGALKIAGGPMLSSTIVEAVTPRDNATVFSGFPATEFDFGLSPTYFESDDLIHHWSTTAPRVLENGYHLNPGNSPRPGNAIAPELFGSFYDSPVSVGFLVSSELMLVKRTFIESIVDLVTSILSAISGVASMFLATVVFVDKLVETKYSLEDVDEGYKKRREAQAAVDKKVDLRVVMQLPFTDEGEPTTAMKADMKDEEGADDEEKSKTKMHQHEPIAATAQDEKKKEEGEEEEEEMDMEMKRKVAEAAAETMKVDSFSAMMASDADCRRVLPLVSLGMGIDLALKFSEAIATTNASSLPAKGPDFDYDAAIERIGAQPGTKLDNVRQVEFLAPTNPDAQEEEMQPVVKHEERSAEAE